MRERRMPNTLGTRHASVEMRAAILTGGGVEEGIGEEAETTRYSQQARVACRDRKPDTVGVCAALPMLAVR